VRQVAQWTLVVVAAVAVLAIAAAVALPYLVDTPRVQALIASNASRSLGRPVTFSSVSVRLFPLPAVELHDLKVADDSRFGGAPFVTLDSGQVRLRLGPLVRGRVEFGDVVLKKPLIRVVQDASGRWNFGSLGTTPGEARTPAARQRGGGGSGNAAVALASRVKIQDGVLTYSARSGRGAASSYRVENLDVTLAGAPGAISVEASMRVTPGDLDLKLKDAVVMLESAHSLTEAPLRGSVSVDGKDLTALARTAAGPSPEMAGGIKGTLVLGGTVGSPSASGDVTLSGLSVTETVPRCPDPKTRTLKIGDVKVHAAWEQGQLTGQPVTTGIGKGTITTTLIATLEHGIHVELRDVGIKALPLDTVLVDFLCQGYAVTGPMDLSGNFSSSLPDVWSTLGGSGQLRIGPGKVVGPQALALLGGVTRLGGAVSSLLGADVPASTFSAPLDFDSITGTFRATGGVVTTRDLLYTSRAMKVAVAGDYALASGRLNLDVTLKHGRGDVQAKVTGTAASPSIRLVPSSVVRGLDSGKFESGLRDLLKRFR
jgi:AsmA-like protein